MKIVTYLHVSRCLEPCGGVGRHANNMVRRLSQVEGVEQTLLDSRESLGSDGRAPENFPLRDLPFRTIPFPELSFERFIRLMGAPGLDRFGPEADWYYAPMETLLPVRKGRARTVVTVQDIFPYETDLPWSDTLDHKRTRRTWGIWMPRLLKSADRIMVGSHFTRSRMLDLLDADPDRVRVVGNGIDDVFFRKGDEVAGKIEKTDEILVLGGLRYKKGADNVMAVADALHRRGSPMKIVVIGQNEPAYLEKAKDHPKIELHGMLPDDVVVDRMAQARVVMLISFYEGFGIPPLEGMACGTVALVSNIASLPEVVGDAGIVIDPTATEDIVDRLEMLRTDDRLYAELVEKGRKHARTYTWERCLANLMEALS